MSFQLSIPENRYEHKVDKDLAKGMVIIYRHLTFIEKKQCYYNCAKNGKIDPENMTEFMYGIAEEMFEGWKGVIDDKTKKPIKFEKSFVKSLPLDIIVDFQDVVGMKHFSDIITSWQNILKRGEKARTKTEQAKNLEAM